MNACDVVGYTCEGEFYCPDCVAEWPAKCTGCGAKGHIFDPGWHKGCPQTLSRDPGHFISAEGEEECAVFANSEWDYYPVCSTCGETCEDVSLTSDGYRWLKLKYEPFEEPYPDRDDLIAAMFLHAAEYHEGQWSKLYRRLSFLQTSPAASYSLWKVKRDGFTGLSDNAVMYYRAILTKKGEKVS